MCIRDRNKTAKVEVEAIASEVAIDETDAEADSSEVAKDDAYSK